ncbi:type IV pilin protein [Paucibacter soli]|uniref:type IV pilin protein n=1 Tax=Paucibacter soli TaxID=3133433 RepID=UPI0030B4EED0
MWMLHSFSSTQDRRVAGFTLVELMITVAVVAILAAVAIPSYLSQVRKGRRSDAVDMAARVMQAQERWRSENSSYATLAQLSISSPTAGGYYSFALSGVAATGYTLTFTGLGSQASDSGCTTLTLTVAAGNGAYTPAACWSR